MSKQNIFVLSAYSLPNLDYKLKEDQLALPDYAVDTNSEKYFFSYSKAKSKLLKLSKEKDSQIFYYSISSYELDTNKVNFTECYDDKLKLISSFNDDDTENFLGIKAGNNKYDVGDWVLFLEYNQVKLGIVGAIPPTETEVSNSKMKLDDYDNCYYILESSHDPSDTFPHSHIKEGFIIEIIPSSMVSQFISDKDRSQIERNYNTYLKKSN